MAPLTLPTLPGRWLQRKQLIYTVHWNDRSGFLIAKRMRDLWIQGPVALFSGISSVPAIKSTPHLPEAELDFELTGC